MRKTISLIGILLAGAAADGGNPCPDSYTAHIFPTRQLTLRSVTLNGKAIDLQEAARFSIVLPENYPTYYPVHPFQIFANIPLAQEESGAGDSVTTFWLADSIQTERIRFGKKP